MNQNNTENQRPVILLVEDDLFVRDLYVRSLSREDFTIEVAVDGAEGLEKAKVLNPSLILLDIMLPKMNGIEVLRNIKTNDATKDIPVFLLTNLGQEAIIKEAFEIGAAGYFLKARLLPQDVIQYVKDFLDTGVVPEASKQI